jgi:diaminohydroxyphosphoribosylaminopyrimidine deaminase/5-amino-6-(5-phosphoribosylamino)uracil reductase
MVMTAADNRWMARALQLARRGLDTTSPNPRVGCVLVKDGAIVGEGWHERAGEPHAEIHALRAAGDAAQGATAYVTLEPCSHHGRTPPCADALIAAGVARVVAAISDPNPRVSGQGLEKLRAAGIEVECGLMEAEARELNIGFFKRMVRCTPWVRSKIAASLDGRTALANGASQWITGEDARRDVQRWRARSCAILTGIGTVLADDPQLSVREPANSRQPLRVVVDSRLRIPPTARILQQGRVLIYTATHDAEKIAALEQAGAQVIEEPLADGSVNLYAVIGDLAARGCNEVLVEAGATLNGALLRGGFVHELVIYLAPDFLGDAARGMVQLGELVKLDQRVGLEWHDVRRVGKDLRIVARVAKPVYEIDGKNFSTLEEFFEEISRVLIPGAGWGHNLNAFNDILRGGFGTPDVGFVIRWVNSALSRERLGYPETVPQLERRLTHCHPSNKASVAAELERARQGIGATVFDWLVEIIGYHCAGGDEQEDGVEVVLE